MITQRIRVVHAPARTPYARKLTSPYIEIVNETIAIDAEVVPRDMSLKWLLSHRPFDWFDVLHLHHVEFDNLDVLEATLSECSLAGKRVVYTAHDINPVFTPESDYRQKQEMLADQSIAWVCLTDASRRDVEQRFGPCVRTSTIPHGYVVPPTTRVLPIDGLDRRPKYFLFGALRENRDIPTVLYNWRFGRRQRDATLSLLLRSPGYVQLQSEKERWALISAMAAVEPRLHIEVLPFPTDDDVMMAALACNALILPYRWGSHSGQLELAFDLALLPVASGVGYLRDQYRRHAAVACEPVWFDWSDGAEYAYGARFLTALDEAAERVRGVPRATPSVQFIEHRIAEHESIMAAYLDVYSH